MRASRVLSQLSTYLSLICVFTFWVACSPVWNSKDTLKLPLLGPLCVCVWWWCWGCWWCVAESVASACWRLLLNWLRQDRTLVLSATQLSSRCRASCGSQLMLLKLLLKLPLLLVACKKFSLWVFTSAVRLSACPLVRSSFRPSVRLSLYALPASRCRHVVWREWKYFLLCCTLSWWVRLSLGPSSQARSLPLRRELSPFSGWVNFWNIFCLRFCRVIPTLFN